MRSLLIALFFIPPIRTAAPPERGAFVTTLGQDTVAVESFTRTANHVEGDLVVRVPGTVLEHYSADFGSDGAVTHTVTEFKPLGTSDVHAGKVTLEIQGEAVRITVEQPGQSPQAGVSMLPKGGYPFFMTGFGSSYGLYSSLAMYEPFLSHVTAKANDTTRVSGVDMGSGKVGTRVFVRRSPTQIDVDYFGIAWTHLTVDANGQITAADARETTERCLSTRTDYLDVKKIAATFAATDKGGHGVGVASPNKVDRASIGGQPIMVAFGSPKKRGRDILGHVVPYDEVWRTGANEATTITLAHDVAIGGTTVPAGTYSLWTLPAHDGTVRLIINKQHGQWGTDYEQNQDLARVPMKVATASAPQEDFAINVTGTGDAGELAITWDTFVWTVPISEK